MVDDALLAWVDAGAPVVLDGEAIAAKRRADYSRRFSEVMYPSEDLGATEEEHQLGVAWRVFELHCELEKYGIDEYLAVWFTLNAPTRAAFKKYVRMAVDSLKNS